MLKFSNDEKIRIFDEIADHFYTRNFGTFSKADMDLLMFHFYIDKITKENIVDDDIDYRSCSDYVISKELGITQQRVRNLKVKTQLVYPDSERDWKKQFAKLIANARLEDNKIYISIPDPNLFIEIENFLDENGKFIEKQMNSKLMVMRIEYFLDLCLHSEDVSNRKKITKRIKEECKKTNKDISKFDDANVGKSLLDLAVNTTSIIASVASLFSSANGIAVNFMNLFC